MAMFSNINLPNRLLKAESEVQKNKNPLHDAVLKRKFKTVSKILQKKSVEINSKDSETHRTALHYAVKDGSIEIVHLLLAHKATVNIEDKEKLTPLFLAVQEADIYMATILIKEYGANVNCEGKDRNTPLHLAISSANVPLAKLILNSQANVDHENASGDTPLILAVKVQSLELVKLLVMKNADIKSKNSKGMSAFCYAVKLGNKEIVEFFNQQNALADDSMTENAHSLEYYTEANNTTHININVASSTKIPTYFQRYTSLHYVIDNMKPGNEEALSLLLKNGTDVNCRDENGSTPLHKVVTDEIMFGLLLNKEPDINAKDGSLKTPLHIAAEEGKSEIARVLLHRGANVHSQDITLLTPLHVAVTGNHVKTVKILLDYHANVNVMALYHETPLHFAVKNGHQNLTSLLVNSQANIEAETIEGWTPFHLAVDKKFVDIAKLLWDKGARVDTITVEGRTPLIGAIQNQDQQMVKLLVEWNADLSFKGFNGTPLHYAARWGNLEIIKFLLDKGANVNATTRDGYTPLHSAIEAENGSDVVSFLLQNGADINMETMCKYKVHIFSPLTLAIARMKYSCVEELLMRLLKMRTLKMKISSQNLKYLNGFIVGLRREFRVKWKEIGSNLAFILDDNKGVVEDSFEHIRDILKEEKKNYRKKTGGKFVRTLSIKRHEKELELWNLSSKFLYFIGTYMFKLSEVEASKIMPYFCSDYGTVAS